MMYSIDGHESCIDTLIEKDQRIAELEAHSDEMYRELKTAERERDEAREELRLTRLRAVDFFVFPPDGWRVDRWTGDGWSLPTNKTAREALGYPEPDAARGEGECPCPDGQHLPMCEKWVHPARGEGENDA